ncbi:hypothetical protein ACFLYQ_01940 [Chloroflexota bacterium]
MKKLKSLLLVYEDGTEKRLELNEIEAGVQSALAGSGLSSPPQEISPADNYLMIQWKDGWQEVLAINSESADLLRYYVIRRIEDKGRLALDTGNDYPELLVVERTPMDISRLLIVSGSDVKSYSLQYELEGYEGTFEAGGKKEYTKFESSDSRFQNVFSKAPENMDGIRNAVAAELNNKKLLPEELLAMDNDHRIREYADIAKTAGIRGVNSQSDVYGFIELILKILSGADADS